MQSRGNSYLNEIEFNATREGWKYFKDPAKCMSTDICVWEQWPPPRVESRVSLSVVRCFRRKEGRKEGRRGLPKFGDALERFAAAIKNHDGGTKGADGGKRERETVDFAAEQRRRRGEGLFGRSGAGGSK